MTYFLRVIIGVCLFLIGPVGLSAQSLLEHATNPRAGRPRLGQTLSFQDDRERNARDFSDTVHSRRYGVDLALPLLIGERSGIAALPGYERLSLENRRGTLPPRLVTAGSSFMGFMELEAPRRIRLASFMRYEVKSDLENDDGTDGQYIISGFAFVSANTYWHFAPGIGYVSDLVVGKLEGVPIPSIEVIYSPNEDFLLAFGAPFNALTWKPSPYFQVFGLNFAGALGEVSIRHQLHDKLSVSESFGTEADVYRLTSRSYPKDTRIFLRGKRLRLSIDIAPFEHLSITLSGAYQYQRRWIIGETQTAGVIERIDLDPGLAFAASISLRF